MDNNGTRDTNRNVSVASTTNTSGLFYSLDYFAENISITIPSSTSANDSWSSTNGTVYWNGAGEESGDDQGALWPRNNESWWKTTGWPDDSPYPSGYSELRIVLTSFFVTIIMIVIVVGNMLVCIAIATEKALKTVQNWFIASLAVSDFLLGLVIMPFSLANELMGYWIFGRVWCDIHSALDVLLCTASINNLCLISLDRYWSVTQAVEYLKKRTPGRALFMICFVWALSALISLPPLVGWNKKSAQSDYPVCALSKDVGYVLYSAFGSFYIPAVVMVFVYIRIFIAARSRARRHVKKRHHLPELTNDALKEKSTTTTTCTSFSNPSPPERGKDDDCEPSTPNDVPSLPRAGRNGTPTICIISQELEVKTPPPPKIVIETPRESPSASPSPRRRFTSEEGDDEYEEEGEEEKAAFFGDEDDVPRVYHLRPGSFHGPTVQYGSVSNTGLPDPAAPVSEPTVRTCLLTATTPNAKSPFGSSASLADYERSDPDDVNQTAGNSSLKGRGGKKGVKKVNKVQYQCDPLPARHTASDAERHKRKVAKARERRATLILGIIMAAFILAWLPFFVLYVVDALTMRECTVCDALFPVAFWLGYCNSALNPIIYTIFNRDFRRAFRKILFK